MKKFLLSLLKHSMIAFFFSISLSSELLAVTYTVKWDGSDDWSDPSTWENSLMPPNPLPAGDEIIVPQNATLELNSAKVIQGTLNLSGRLAINSGGSLTNNGTLAVNGRFDVKGGGSFTNTSILNLNSGGFMWFDTNPVSLPGGTFNWNGGKILASGDLTFNTPFTIPVGGELEFRANLFNNNTITVNGKLNFHLSNIFTNNGTLNLNSGGRLFYNYPGAIPPTGTFNWNSGGTIEAHYTCNMVLNNPLTIPPGGILEILGKVTNNSTLTNQGIIKSLGSGNRELVQNGTFSNTGSIAPGASPGKLTVTGNLNLGSGTYNCKINGTVQGTAYDWLAVSGNATLTNASLVVDWGGFTPSAGQTYTVMTFGSKTGTFSNVTIPPVTGLYFTTNYTFEGDRLTITVTQ